MTGWKRHRCEPVDLGEFKHAKATIVCRFCCIAVYIYTNKEGGMIIHPALVLLDSLAIFLGNALPISLMSFIPLKGDY